MEKILSDRTLRLGSRVVQSWGGRSPLSRQLGICGHLSFVNAVVAVLSRHSAGRNIAVTAGQRHLRAQGALGGHLGNASDFCFVDHGVVDRRDLVNLRDRRSGGSNLTSGARTSEPETNQRGGD